MKNMWLWLIVGFIAYEYYQSNKLVATSVDIGQATGVGTNAGPNASVYGPVNI